MNKIHHETTKFTPTELHLGKKPRKVWEKYLFIMPEVKTLNNKRILLACEKAHKIALKREAKKNAQAKHFQLEKGDSVMIKALNLSEE